MFFLARTPFAPMEWHKRRLRGTCPFRMQLWSVNAMGMAPGRKLMRCSRDPAQVLPIMIGDSPPVVLLEVARALEVCVGYSDYATVLHLRHYCSYFFFEPRPSAVTRD